MADLHDYQLVPIVALEITHRVHLTEGASADLTGHLETI